MRTIVCGLFVFALPVAVFANDIVTDHGIYPEQMAVTRFLTA